MLKVMRKHARYFYVLFVLVILSFIFWGVGTVDKSTQSVLIEVGDQNVSVEEYWRAYDRMVDIYRDVYGEKFDDRMQEELKQSVLDMLVEGRVLYLAAVEAGIMVTDEELKEDISHDPTFTREGVFDSEVYRKTLELNRMTPQYYEALKRRELMVDKMKTLINETVDVTPQELESIKGAADMQDALKEAILESKRTAAVRSYVDGLRKQMDVRVNSQLIS